MSHNNEALMETHEFMVKPGSFESLRKKLAKRFLLVSLLSMAVAIAVARSNSPDGDYTFYLMLIPVLAGIFIFSFFRSMNMQKKIFESYRLKFDLHGITREQHNTPVMRLGYFEVKEIVKNANGSFTVKGPSALNVIGIPAQVDGYAEIERLLGEVKPVTVNAKPTLLQKFSGLVSILMIVCMAGFVISENKVIVGLCAAYILVAFTWAFIVIRRSRNVDARLKRTGWLLLLIGICIALSAYGKLTGNMPW